MSSSQSNYHGSKTLRNFLSENLPNQIIFNCLKNNTDLSDETIEQAFVDAYGIGREIIANPILHTERSKSFNNLACRFDFTSLLSHSILYALLSFHKDAPKLGMYLSNLKTVLENRCPDVFLPIFMFTVSTASIIPGTVSFQPKTNSNADSDITQFHNDTNIPISMLLSETKKISKKEALVVLNFLKRIIAMQRQDFLEILNLEIKQVEAQPDKLLQSNYVIADGHVTDFCKLMKALYHTHIIRCADGNFPSNQEIFIQDMAALLNTNIPNPSTLLSSARNTKNYMSFFERLSDLGMDYYTKGDGIIPKTHIPKPGNSTLF